MLKNALKILFVVICLMPATFAQAYKYVPNLPDGSPWVDYKWKSFNSVDKYLSSGVIINEQTGYAYELIRTTAMHVPALLEHSATRTWDYQGQTLQGQLVTVNTKATYDWLESQFYSHSANAKAKNALPYDQRWDLSRSDIKGDTAFATVKTWTLAEILTGGYYKDGQKQWESGAAWGFDYDSSLVPTSGLNNWLYFYEKAWRWGTESCLAGYIVEYKLPSATPIPAALPLLGTGLAGLIALKRRNKA